MFCLVYIFPPLFFKERGARGVSQRGKIRGRSAFSIPKIKDKSFENYWFFILIFILDNGVFFKKEKKLT
jgi:hypothetical protein